MENIKAMGSGAKVIDKIFGTRKATLFMAFFAEEHFAIFLLHHLPWSDYLLYIL
jgi:hypothetical protein